MVDDPVQRREDRKDVNWIAKIRFADGSDYPCTVKDVSASGLKIAVPEDQDLPETFMIKVVGMNLVFRVKKAWRRKHFVGCIIEKIAKLPDPPPAAPEHAARSGASQEQHARLGTRKRYEALP